MNASYLLLAALFLLVAAAIVLWLARRTQRAAGLPTGVVIYSDTGVEHTVTAPLVSRRHGLVGKPDYLVEVSDGKDTLTIPVEVKSGRRPPETAEGHVLQLGAYCLLVEDLYGCRPPYGLLRYADQTVNIQFTDTLRTEVMRVADRIRRQRTSFGVKRSHRDPRRCRGCGYLDACGEEALV